MVGLQKCEGKKGRHVQLNTQIQLGLEQSLADDLCVDDRYRCAAPIIVPQYHGQSSKQREHPYYEHDQRVVREFRDVLHDHGSVHQHGQCQDDAVEAEQFAEEDSAERHGYLRGDGAGSSSVPPSLNNERRAQKAWQNRLTPSRYVGH